MYALNIEEGIMLSLEQHEEFEREWVEKPVPQWIYKEWTVLDEQVTLDQVIECIANSGCCDFVDFTDEFMWGSDYFEFVSLIEGEPHVFHVDREDAKMLNAGGGQVIRWIPGDEVADTIKEVMDRHFSAA